MTQNSGRNDICSGCGQHMYIRKDDNVKLHCDTASYVNWYCSGSDKPPVFGTIAIDGSVPLTKGGNGNG